MLSSIYFTFLVENMKIAVGKNCTTDFTDTDCTDIQLLYFSNRHVILLLLFSRSVMSASATTWTAARQASLSFKISQSLLKLIYWVSDAIQLCHPLSSTFLPSFNLFQYQGLLQWVSSSHQVAKILAVSPYNEYPGLTSFSIDWFDLLF